MKHRSLLYFFCMFVSIQCTNFSYIDKDFVLIEGGYFQLGDTTLFAEKDEFPIDSVNVNDFYLSKYEVSQKVWNKVMKFNPSYHKGDDLPVECVSYNDVCIFLERLNQLSGGAYRLPTEIEWEYAAKCGLYDTKIWQCHDSLGIYSWYEKNSEMKSHTIGTLSCNRLGIFDMIGNVNEWCQDRYEGKNYYGERIDTLEYINQFVFRGGCFGNDEQFLRITNRNHASSDTRNFSLGFRLAKDAVTTKY